MKRLTKTFEENGQLFACLPECEHICTHGWDEDNSGCRCSKFTDILKRLAAIEDILGDDYDLDRLEVMVNQCMTMRDEVAERFSITAKIPIDRLREMVEADRDGRCVVLPAGGYNEKDGENALKSSMNTVFYHNNPVTRYIADAVAEKLVREEAALKGEHDA